ncbi:ABC-type sugar transport system, maltose-binding protein [Maize bushy stunt phytoplasma]|uniref:ABC-type sugar transport system, maltose-binding protein n=1 Tax=Maize bushy stunt phytoplasma TaxID=202462 RepID=A0ABN4RYZ7_9MOLU|nr:extracellular solute-binding protein [Maize bushy stunt phytoplasma]AOF55029.1 ABC-type sugar transport system, maltose-binding protein [Maize bushy stunt phytoplasma]
MVSKDKSKIIHFFTCLFVILAFIVLFPKIDSNALRNNHEQELNEMLTKYKDSEAWEKFLEKPIEIVFWHRLDPEKEKGKPKNALEEIIEEFREKYPKIKVKTEYKPSWSGIVKNINVALPANNEPHLIVSYADHLVNYYESGKLVPLDGFKDHTNEKIKLDPCTTDPQTEKTYFYSSFENEAQLPLGNEKEPGKWYSLPFSKSIELMYYNQDYFKQLKGKIQKQKIGIDSDFESCFDNYDNSNFEGKLKDGITWEQMKKLCKVIKQVDSEKIPISYDSESNLFIISSEQRGIEYTTSPIKKDPSSREVGVRFNNPDAKKMIKDFKKFYDKKYLITRKLSGESYTTHLFMDQKILMDISSSNGFEYVSKAPFKVGITSVPYWKKGKQGPESGKRKVLQQGSNINLFYKKDKDEVLASWLFLKHLTSKETNEKLIQKLSQFPTRPCYDKSAQPEQTNSENPSKNSKNPEINKDIFDFMKRERKEDEESSQTGNPIYFFSPTFRKSQMSRIVVEKLVIDCFLDKDLDKNIDTLFNEAQQKANS